MQHDHSVENTEIYFYQFLSKICEIKASLVLDYTITSGFHSFKIDYFSKKKNSSWTLFVFLFLSYVPLKV